MQTKFKRHQKVRILINPTEEDVEPYADPPIGIKKGMTGKINMILPNGRYHVEIIQDDETIAYVALDEDQLELVEDDDSDEHEESPEDWA